MGRPALYSVLLHVSVCVIVMIGLPISQRIVIAPVAQEITVEIPDVKHKTRDVPAPSQLRAARKEVKVREVLPQKATEEMMALNPPKRPRSSEEVYR